MKKLCDFRISYVVIAQKTDDYAQHWRLHYLLFRSQTPSSNCLLKRTIDPNLTIGKRAVREFPRVRLTLLVVVALPALVITGDIILTLGRFQSNLLRLIICFLGL